MITAQRHGRHIKPRKIDYSNEEFGINERDWGEDLFCCQPDPSYAIEDRIPSCVLIRRARNWPLESTDPWHESGAYQLLSPENYNSGIWIPWWVGHAVSNSSKARLLSWLLWWFDDESTRSRVADRGPERVGYEAGPCRSRVRDSQGNRCLGTSISRLSREVNLSRTAVRQALAAFEQDNLIRTAKCQSGEFKGHLLIRFNAPRIASYYKKATGDSKTDEEFGKGGYFYDDVNDWGSDDFGDKSKFRPGWYESDTRLRAMTRDGAKASPVSRGTWVSDWLFVVCEKKAAPAQVLSQVLWWFSTRVDNNGFYAGPRARIRRHGYLWIAKSPRQLNQETGLPVRTVRRALDYLIKERKFLIEGCWVFDPRRDRGRPTLHLRPNAKVLEDVLRSETVEDEAWRIEYERMGNAM